MEPVIDLPVVLERVEDDSELLRELVRLFVDNAPLRLAAIRDAVNCRDAKALQQSAHALKGSAGSLAALGVFAAARELEQIGSRGEWTHAEDAYATLEAELGRLTAVVVKLLVD